MRKSQAIILAFLFCWFLAVLPIWADVDTKDGTSITTASDMDGFTSNISTADGVAVAAAGGDCPSGTYKFAWNGQHPSGANYGCWDSGTTSEAGVVTGLTVTSDYATINDSDERMEFTSGAPLDADIGTVWMDLWIVTSPTAQCGVYESVNTDSTQLMVLANDTVLGIHFNGGWDDVPSDAALSEGEWERVAYSWSTAANEHVIYANGFWNSADAETLGSVDPAPDHFRIGEYESGAICTGEIRIRNVYFIESYKANDPM